MQHNSSKTLRCHLTQWRLLHNIVWVCLLREKREETHSGFTLSQKLIATCQKFQIIVSFWKNKHQDDENMCLIKHRNVHPSMGGCVCVCHKLGLNSHGIITEFKKKKKIRAAVFCLLTKVLFTALCALLRLFWGGSELFRQPWLNSPRWQEKGKSPRHTTQSRVLQIFIETCSSNMFTSLVDVNLLITKLAGYTNKKFVYMYSCTINRNPDLSLFHY